MLHQMKIRPSSFCNLERSGRQSRSLALDKYQHTEKPMRNIEMLLLMPFGSLSAKIVFFSEYGIFHKFCHN